MSQVQTNDDVDLVQMLGLDDSPTDSNDLFWYSITDGSYKKIHNLRYWLRGEISRYHHLLEQNVKITKSIMKDGRLQDSPLSKTEYAKIAVAFYLDMYHLPWFLPRENFVPADQTLVIERIVAYPDVKEVIEAQD